MTKKARALWGFQHNAEAVRQGDRITVDGETFAKLKANGLVEEDDGSSKDETQSGIDLDGMNVAELRALAEAQGIDLGEAKKKDELQAVIKAGLASKAG